MKVLRIILVLLGLLVLLVVGIGFFGPTSMDVSHTKKLNAPMASVFEQVVELKNWPNWSPWSASDPDMKVTYGDITKGEGGTYSWNGPETGIGKMDIREVIPGEKIGMDIGFDMGDGLQYSKCDMFFKEAEDGTEVTWTFNSSGATGFWERIMNVVMPSMLTGMYEQGLTGMEAAALAHPFEAKKETVLSAGVRTEDFGGFHYLGERYENVNVSEIGSDDYSNSYGKIMTYLGATNAMDKLVQPPISITEAFDRETMVSTFSVAMKTTEKLDGTDDLHSSFIPGHTAMVLTHTGSYESISETYEKLVSVIMAKGMTVNYPCYEVYITDPGAEPDPTKWKTDVVIPVKWAE